MTRLLAVRFLETSDAIPADRRWCGNDESARQHHGVVALSESPLVLELNWRASKSAAKKRVCLVRLELPWLLGQGLVRREDAKHERLRFFHDRDGKVYIQQNLDGPRYLIGRI